MRLFPTKALFLFLVLFASFVALTKSSSSIEETNIENDNDMDTNGNGGNNNLQGDTKEQDEEFWWEDLALIIHRNGEPDPCGSALPATSIKFRNVITDYTDKYELESYLTDMIADSMLEEENNEGLSCASPDNATATFMGLYGYCDMGIDRTPILEDYVNLKRVENNNHVAQTLPCRWYTREGMRIASLDQLKQLAQKSKSLSSPSVSSSTNNNNAQQPTCMANPQDGDCMDVGDDDSSIGAPAELHLYGVPAGRVFMFGPSYVGEYFDLSHLTTTPDPEHPISMKVLSTNPRVFDIFNVFTPEEADDLVDRALKETSPTHKIKRSTTGTTENSIFNKRTSENAFDTHGKTALDVKRRIFELLGFDEYWYTHDDGLQILRYNTSKAYVQHMDYMTDRSGTELFNYDSAGKGGNRFATVLLYMSDLEEGSGGETVFSEAWPPELDVSERKTIDQALADLRASGDAELAGIEQGSWEEKMIATCRSKFSVQPYRGRAVLFYSQHPNGKEDRMSKHGGCPVLKEQPKWAANLWVWNTPRTDQPGAPLREDLLAKGYKPPATNLPQQLRAEFINTGTDPTLKDAELWYDESMYWGKLGHNDPPLAFNTFEGHRWNLRVNNQIVKQWVIGPEAEQVFRV